MSRKSIDQILAAQATWGMLTPIRFARMDSTVTGKKKPVWLFHCDCGVEVEIRAYSVTSRKTRSCGCIRATENAERFTTHGHAKSGALTLTYRSWRNMLTRALNPNIANAHRYSGRGIGVVDQWNPAKSSIAFQNFLDHLGERPSSRHMIDRIDPDRSYEPGNVRWVTARDANEITCRGRFVVVDGLRLTVAEAARRTGVKASIIRDRLRLGWKYDDLFNPRARSPFGRGPSSRPGVLPRD